MRVLHIIPKSAYDKTLADHGSTKDIWCRREYFKNRGFDTLELPVSKHEKLIISNLEKIEIKEFDTILIDIPRSFRITFQYIRRRAPKVKLVFRSHNAEFLHRWDWMVVSCGWRKKLGCAKRALEGLINDIRTLHVVDFVIPIVEWDTRYWRSLGNKKKVVTVPFYLGSDKTWGTEENKNRNYAKDNLCVCITAVQQNPLINDAAQNFSHLVNRLGMDLPHWSFAITGNTDGMKFLGSRIKRLGFVSSLEVTLSQAKAVAILSDYGRGFKTKILDAFKGCAYVLVTPRLFRHLPNEVKPFCFAVNKHSVEDFVRVLKLCSEPFPRIDVNKVFRKQAFDAMDKVFGVK